MRLRIFFATLAAVASFQTALGQAQAPEETVVEARLENVTVYMAGAELTSQGRLANIQAGTHQLVLQGLSPHLDARSISVTGEGMGVIQSVTYRQNFRNRTHTPARLGQIRDSLELLGMRQTELADETFVLEKEKELILKNGTLSTENHAVTAASLAELAAFYRNRLTQIRQRLSQIGFASLKLAETQARLAAERAELNANRDVPTHEVLVAYNARVNGPLNLTLKYRVTAAAWRPEYDLRLAPDVAQGNLTLRAQVYNNSGIDWKQVKLTLSNTVPAQNNDAPVVDTWYLSALDPRTFGYDYRSREMGGAPVPTQAPRAQDAEEGAVMLGQSSQGLPGALTGANFTQQTHNLLATEFAINLRRDIPSDNKPHAADVQVYKIPTGYQHYAAPKRSQFVFLQAQLTDWGRHNLLPGPVQVFFDGSYIGQSNLNPATTDDTLRISLGRDPLVSLKREAMTEFTSRKAIGSNIREERGFRIMFRNTRRNAIRIRVVESLPVSQDSRIEVTPLAFEGWSRNLENGRLTADIEVAPDATRELSFRFEVKFPKDLTVVGL